MSLSAKSRRNCVSQPVIPSYQPQPTVQQTAPSISVSPPPQPVKKPEKARFWPHCGSPATECFSESWGAKID